MVYILQFLSFEEIAQFAKVGQSIRPSFPHLANFYGKHQIQLLSFVRNCKGAYGALGIHEGAAVRVLTPFLEGKESTTYQHPNSLKLKLPAILMQRNFDRDSLKEEI